MLADRGAVPKLSRTALLQPVRIDDIDPDALRIQLDQLAPRGAPAACWLFVGFTDRDGYGILTHHRRHLRAHRARWILEHGAIQRGLLVLHSCDQPGCTNPHHLRVGTHLDNARDAIERRRRARLLLARWEIAGQLPLALTAAQSSTVSSQPKDACVGTGLELIDFQKT